MNTQAAKTPHLSFELFLLGVLAFLWGSSYLLIKVAVATIPPLTLMATRVAIAALFLLAVMRWQRARFPKDRKIWRMLLVQAFFNSIGSWTVLAWGQQYLDSGLAGVLNSTSPIFVFFITLLFTRHEAISRRMRAGAFFGGVGVLLVVGADALLGVGREVVAELAVLLGALLYACAAVYGKRFSHLPPTVTAAGTMVWATIWLVPMSLMFDSPWTLDPSIHSVLAAMTLAIFCTGGALLIYFRLVRTLGSMGVASQSYLRAGISVLLGMAILGERVTPIAGLGLLAIILGVAAINIPKPKR